MPTTPFNSQKMRWLNAINADCSVNANAFRVAYVIADHLNRVTGSAWPSIERIAKRVCSSGKSVSRAVAQLERAGWLQVERNRRNTNHYRLSWPRGTEASLGIPLDEASAQDTTAYLKGQERGSAWDRNAPQSYLRNLSKTYSSRLGERRPSKPAFRDQGAYEQRIIDRFGPQTWDLLTALAEFDANALQRLCEAERAGVLSVADIEAARLAVLHFRRPGR